MDSRQDVTYGQGKLIFGVVAYGMSPIVLGGARGAMASPDRLTLSPLRGADYVYQKILELPDFQTFRRP